MVDNNYCCLETPAHIWYIIARKLNGEASAQEEQELIDLLREDEDLQQQYELLERIWKEKSNNIKEEDNLTTTSIISRIICRAAVESDDAETLNRRKRQRRRRSISLTAVLLVCLIAAGWFWKSNNMSSVAKRNLATETIITQNGSRTRSILADGTIVWLNVGSKLICENDFNGATREVRLEGEAFFDVVKQSNRPFIVHTSGIDIRVLGTAFNVKSYPEDKNVETTLYRGLVQVKRPEDAADKAIPLTPNHKLIIPKQAAIEATKLSENKRLSAKERALPVVLPIDSTKKESERIETAWVYDRMEFWKDNFEDVAKKLERWYNVTIVFADEKTKQLRVTGTFTKETVEQAFAALKVAFPMINYQINKNHEIFVESSQ